MDNSDLITKMHDFNRQPEQGISFTLGMEDKEDLKYYERSCQPCYGEMRTYKKTPDDRKPSDLYDPFPDGTPVAVGINTQYMRDQFILNWFLTGETSPYRNLFSERIELTKEKDKILGFVLTDTLFNPDYLIQGLVHIRGLTAYSARMWEIFADSGIDPYYTLILSHQSNVSSGGICFEGKVNQYSYSLPSLLSFKRLKEADPALEKDFYFRDRAPYHRKGLENIWRGEDHLWNQEEIRALKGKNLNYQEIKEKVLPVIDRLAQ